MTYRVPMDGDRLRALCQRRPPMSQPEIAARLGVSRQAVQRAIRRHGIAKTPCQPGPRAACRSDYTGSGVVAMRCLACGGRIAASVAHQCRPAEPLTTGLVWTRGAA